jgi:hypothetical protein
MNSFADYFGRDDLNVCKRARENGRSHPLENCGVAEIPVMQEGLLAPPSFSPASVSLPAQFAYRQPA